MLNIIKKFFLLNENNNWFSYDFVSITNKKCIEFNGDFWHCNPKSYDQDHVHRISKLKASDIWKMDSDKVKLINDRGFKVLVIWESEYYKNPQQVLERCIEFMTKR